MKLPLRTRFVKPLHELRTLGAAHNLETSISLPQWQ